MPPDPIQGEVEGSHPLFTLQAPFPYAGKLLLRSSVIAAPSFHDRLSAHHWGRQRGT